MIAILAVVFLVAILSFPFVLRRLTGVGDNDWQTLSNVGQAYGAISAILSGLALCGVAFSVTLQWRQVVWARMVSARERHFELIKLMLDDPRLSHETREGDTPERTRRKLVNNLWVSHWLLLWDIGEMDPEFLKSSFDELFVDSLAREWWFDFGPTWLAKKSRRHDEFMSIAWASYHRCAQAAATLAADDGPEPAELSSMLAEPRQSRS